MERAVHRVFLALGSNIAPEQNLPLAAAIIATFGTITAWSRVWQSAPFGFAAQSDFLNAAVLLETELSAEAIIEQVIPAVEQRLGRQRNPANKNGPRTIDVDLVLFDHDVRRVAGKSLPDPTLLEYPFVACPIAELAPDYLHPVTGEALASIAQRLCGPDAVQLRSDVQLDAASTNSHAANVKLAGPPAASRSAEPSPPL